MSRDLAATLRNEPSHTPESVNRVLEHQLAEARGRGGELDLDTLLKMVSAHYDRIDAERRGVVLSMQLMSDEAQALTREIREETASHLQAILDNVKDAIVTVDDSAHIEIFNPTGERIFGYSAAEILGRTLDYLLPDVGSGWDAPGELTSGPSAGHWLASARIVDFLERCATKIDDTHVDLAAHQTWGLAKGGTRVAVEIAVSKASLNRRDGYIVCIRDTTERHLAELSMRESEARYRTLVEHAPEVIVVFDVDQGRFVDVNDNACRFFKMDREALLASGPDKISPQRQPDGSPSFGAPRGYIDGALAGATPVFEWVHCDALGQSLPCEVRFVRLPSSNRRLIRASITDITERKRADAIAAGERRVFEKIAANAPLLSVLEAISEVIERVIPDSFCAINLLDNDRQVLRFGVAPSLPREFVAAMDNVPIGIRFGSCAAAVYLARQVTVANIESDALWEFRREAAMHAGLRAAWSSPIVASDGPIVGTFSVYQRQPGLPLGRDHELMSRMAQIAGIAIERRSAEDALRDSEAKFRGLFESVMEGVYSTTRDGRILVVNPAFVQMLGYASAEEIYQVPAGSLYWYLTDRDSYVRRMDSEGEVRNVEYVLRRKDGTMLVVVDNGRVVRDKQGRISGYEGTIADITERKKAETAVFQAKERAQVTLQSIGDAVITTDFDGRIDYMNPVAESLTGWENREAQNQLIGTVLTVVDESSRESIESPVMRCLREGQVLGLAEHTVLVNRRGQEIAIQDSAAPIRDRAGNLIGAVMVFHDISKERRLHRALHYQASHDALTGLINRREFENRLTAAVDSVRQDAERRHALLYLDLDQFKLVNDTCGHPAGDQLLKQITGVLQSRVRGGDTLARLGGDEFGILLQSCSLDQALRVAETLRQAIRDYRFIWQDGVLAVGVSIGIVEITSETPTVANVMSAADVACYAAKDQGRNRVQLYQPDNVPERHREMHWVSKLTRACDESRFELFYQPIVPIGANRSEREQFELMLRLRDESGALIAPAEFIPAAERYNVMPSIDRWVVRQALDQLAHRSGSGIKPYTIAVNLSGTSLNDERFLEYLIAELSARDLAAGAMCFEITETAAIANLGNVVYFMRELKTRGCHFALDDFGSGLSSFMYLKTLPVDYLKIDGQFIENVARDPVDRSMVEAISQVGKAMGIHTIAERVESHEVLLELGRLGIGFAQGFYIAPPRSTSEFPYLRN
ncbi:MAG TPA: EAL domain-containing protein [Steroidobacteraceae bacterium]|nr:EAL domain-containing protein [Steroidobacteraceae bacterium]